MAEQNQKPEQREKPSPIIKVFGVGGGGGNAVNYMKTQGITDVDFFVCNTDSQALERSPVENKIPIGQALTEGRGAGNNPEIGKKAALESEEGISQILKEGTKMLFVTAGLGGGTGTGAVPVIASIAQKQDILTIGIVTIPFKFEGQVRLKQAIKGLEEMEKHVDSLLVINNEELRKIHGDLKISEAFAKADDVLLVAVKGIAEIITVHGHVNVDFADVRTVMKNSGVAILGSAYASGENRGIHAIKKALDSPLLNSNDICGAKNVLLNVTSGNEEFRLDELGQITDYVQSTVKNDVQIIWGNGIDESLGDKIRVVIIATGFKKDNIHEIFAEKKKIEKKELLKLNDLAPSAKIKEPPAIANAIYNDKTKAKSNIEEPENIYPLKDEIEEKTKTVQPEVSENVIQQRLETYQKKNTKKRKRKMPKVVKFGEWFQTSFIDKLFDEEQEKDSPQ
ncbi:MAG: cell division protein FtsZ [Bacteroidota bacterium]|nr:cell division protein FtsZ [Bacteroidota bacterium]